MHDLADDSSDPSAGSLKVTRNSVGKLLDTPAGTPRRRRPKADDARRPAAGHSDFRLEHEVREPHHVVGAVVFELLELALAKERRRIATNGHMIASTRYSADQYWKTLFGRLMRKE